MNILFVSDTYYPHLNGVYYFVCRISPLLEKRRHRVAVIVPSETVHSSFKKIDGIDVYGMPSLPVVIYPKVRIPLSFGLKSRIRKLIDEFDPNIIHVQDHFILSKAAIAVGTKKGIPVMGTNHFMPENLTSLISSEKWKKKISLFLWKNFSKTYNQLLLVTTPSETAASLIRPKLKVEVRSVSSGVNLDQFNPQTGPTDIRKKYGIPEKPFLLFVGRLDPEKNIEEIIHAVATAIKKEDFCFVIVGKGIRREALERLAVDLGIRGHIIFTGFVPDEDLPFIYKLSRCFIISSYAELLSLSALQGMAAGLPLIAVNKGALGELVQDRVNGFLYESGDMYKLVRSICDIMGHEDVSEHMSLKSLEFVQKHDIRQTVFAFEKIYSQLSHARRTIKTEYIIDSGELELSVNEMSSPL
jgi:glycosyltransferase involved in cell wall biosynthesis